jgi:hypothetical protein
MPNDARKHHNASCSLLRAQEGQRLRQDEWIGLLQDTIDELAAAGADIL